ncbi:MAG: hypothetical protein IJN75_05255 [Clostridia bacterium]|nr:hypothetical protein [Clostridia bacterium]
MILSQAATEIIKRLEEASFEAFAVGGAVRDVIMGRVPNDFDVATSARTDEIKALFSNLLVIPTGEKHGTVTVLRSGEPIEVTTFRVDGLYNDSRHPEKVVFVGDVETDLARRDFTMNAIAYNDRCGFVDPFGGIDDIKAKTIRSVGDAEVRFREDALRIMRCIRFASVLGFRIEKETDDALKSCHELLLDISKERIFSELKLFLSGDFQRYLKSHGYIFELLFPGWNAPDEACPDGCDALTRMAYFFSKADVEAADGYLRSLKADNATRRGVAMILRAMKHPRITSKREALYFLSEYGYDTAFRAALLRADEEEAMLIEEHRGECYSYDRLAIGGKDIMALGYSGIEVREAKKRLLHAVIDGEVENNLASLLEFLAR